MRRISSGRRRGIRGHASSTFTDPCHPDADARIPFANLLRFLRKVKGKSPPLAARVWDSSNVIDSEAEGNTPLPHGRGSASVGNEEVVGNAHPTCADRRLEIGAKQGPPLPHGCGSEKAGRGTGTIRPAGKPVPQRSPRVDAVALHFGIGANELSPRGTAVDHLPQLPATGLVLISGASGSGKSSALRTYARQFPDARRVGCPALHHDHAMIDQVAPWADMVHAAGILTACGLGEPRLWLRRPAELSDGERFRAQLAWAVALHEQDVNHGIRAPLLCDEFASGLHRRVARAIAFNLRKLVARRSLLMVLATSRDDVHGELRPDMHIRMQGIENKPEIENRTCMGTHAFRLRKQLRIFPGTKRDYEHFAAMHYRRTDELGFVDRVFVLRARSGHEPLGIIVYAHAPLELALRNQSTNNYFRRRPDRVNAELRTIRRVVIHPDVRGCGLGHWLIRKTLPLVGAPFVETQTALGEFNPIFERAGMRRVGQVALGPRRRDLQEQLKGLNVDPGDADFVTRVCRDTRLRQLALGTVQRWYGAICGCGAARANKQTPEVRARLFRGLIATRPVYYLWEKKGVRRKAQGKSENWNQCDRMETELPPEVMPPPPRDEASAGVSSFGRHTLGDCRSEIADCRMSFGIA